MGAGATVEIGSPTAKWLDCALVLVDVPVSDVEAALVRPDMPAEIVVESETRIRPGSVLLARRAQGTLGEDGIAEGRRPGIGQVIVKLEPVGGEQHACPVGLAAHVDFLGIGLLDLLRARLGV